MVVVLRDELQQVDESHWDSEPWVPRRFPECFGRELLESFHETLSGLAKALQENARRRLVVMRFMSLAILQVRRRERLFSIQEID